MCSNLNCLCQNLNQAQWSDLFLTIWDAQFTIEEEQLIDQDPEISRLRAENFKKRWGYGAQ